MPVADMHRLAQRDHWLTLPAPGLFALLPEDILAVILEMVFPDFAPFGDQSRARQRTVSYMLRACRGFHRIIEQFIRAKNTGDPTIPKSLSAIKVSHFQMTLDHTEAKSSMLCTVCRISAATRRFDGSGRTCHWCLDRDADRKRYDLFYLTANDVRWLFKRQLALGRVKRGVMAVFLRNRTLYPAEGKYGKHHSITLGSLLRFIRLSSDPRIVDRRAAYLSIKTNGREIAKPWFAS